MGDWCPPYYGKSKFWQKKKAKVMKKIAKYTKIVEECDKEIAKNENK